MNKLTIDRIDPFLSERSLAWLSLRRIPPEILLAPAFASVVLFVVLAKFSNSLSMDDVPLAVCQDVGHLLESSKLSCVNEPSVPAAMPLARDVWSIVLMFAAVLSPYLVYKQWTGFHALIPTLSRNGLILDRYPGSDAVGALTLEVDAMNRYFRGPGSSTLFTSLIAAIAMASLMVGERAAIYRPLAPPSDAEWPTKVWDKWWANPAISSWSWMLYFVVGFVAVYYIVRMNLVGSRVVLGLWRVRRRVLYGADVDNADGDYGWKPVTRILSATWVALILHGAGLLSLMVLLDIPNWVLLVPLLGQWLVLLPFYTILPLVIVMRDVRRFRKMKEKETQLVLAAIPSSDVVQRTTVAQRLRDIRDLPLLLPFHKWWTARSVIGAIFAFAAALWTTAKVIWDVNLLS
ncbi:hypothetical protein OG921_04040 [Aldersonia sp. NBC_00410]|uniref:hypothetical protein n=1 Tax=Aldersonia sp. NBC_00410 TaxID=2975954 RepID=UPI00225113E5|nr:hypothetical protein [Aldersonia sp. NBC_00410]MCX5042358.1 hypothetical protein [Aldersonia sp. NBC_00410]